MELLNSKQRLSVRINFKDAAIAEIMVHDSAS